MAKSKQQSKKAWSYISVGKGRKSKIDSEDLKRVSEYTWYVVKKPSGRLKVVTNIRKSSGYRQVSLGNFLMKPPKGKMVYPRRFMEELDYRKDNLIVCTMKERQRILPKSRNIGASRFKGVSYNKPLKKWQASIKVDGRSMNLGVFKKETDAAVAYNQAARKHFGDIGYQNLLNVAPRNRRKKR